MVVLWLISEYCGLSKECVWQELWQPHKSFCEKEDNDGDAPSKATWKYIQLFFTHNKQLDVLT